MSIQLFSDAETHETLPEIWSDGELAALLQFIQLCKELMLIAEIRVKRRSNISWTLRHKVRLRFCNFVTLLTQLQSRVHSRNPAIIIPQKHVQHSSFSCCTTENKLLLTLTGARIAYLHIHRGLTCYVKHAIKRRVAWRVGARGELIVYTSSRTGTNSPRYTLLVF